MPASIKIIKTVLLILLVDQLHIKVLQSGIAIGYDKHKLNIIIINCNIFNVAKYLPSE